MPCRREGLPSPLLSPVLAFSLALGANLFGPTSLMFQKRGIQIPYLQVAVLVITDTSWRMEGGLGEQI